MQNMYHDVDKTPGWHRIAVPIQIQVYKEPKIFRVEVSGQMILDAVGCWQHWIEMLLRSQPGVEVVVFPFEQQVLVSVYRGQLVPVGLLRLLLVMLPMEMLLLVLV